MNFQQWMGQVDDLCMLEYSMSIYDLPDMPFHDAYDSGQTPEEFTAENLGDLESLGHLILS